MRIGRLASATEGDILDGEGTNLNKDRDDRDQVFLTVMFSRRQCQLRIYGKIPMDFDLGHALVLKTERRQVAEAVGGVERQGRAMISGSSEQTNMRLG